MAIVTPKMSLTGWNQLTDPYDHTQLFDNFSKIDFHDHSPGRGVLIPTEGIADGAVTSAKLASTVLPQLVSSLPVAPFDTQEVYYQNATMASQGVVWHLRYRLAVSKWEYVGGGALSAATAAGGGPASVTGTVWSNAPATQTEITLPLSGDYSVSAMSTLLVVPSGQTAIGVAVGAAGTPSLALQATVTAAGNAYVGMTINGTTTGRSASDLLRVRYYVTTTGNITVTATTLQVTPIRVTG